MNTSNFLACKVIDNALKFACCFQHFEVAKLLLEQFRAYPSTGTFGVACEAGNLAIIQLLLADDRVDPNESDCSPFFNAIDNGQVDVLKLLLTDSRIDPAVKNNFAVVKACSKDNLELLQVLLLDPRVDPSVNNNNCLQQACKIGIVGVVRILLQHERVSQNIGETLKIALAHRHKNVIDVLLEYQK